MYTEDLEYNEHVHNLGVCQTNTSSQMMQTVCLGQSCKLRRAYSQDFTGLLSNLRYRWSFQGKR